MLQRFDLQVEHSPDSAAVVYRDEYMSYGELDARANRLARWLQKRGVGADVVVGLCVERGIDAVTAILAVFKAGGSYLPLDPDYPQERLSFMLADAMPPVLLTQQKLLGSVSAALPDGGAPEIALLDGERSSFCDESSGRIAESATADNLAYVIYTSGSTGNPKGVLVERRGVCNMSAAQQQLFALQPGDPVLHFSSLSFDASVFEIFMAFGAGATLVVAPPEARTPGPELIRLLQQQAIKIVTLPPSVLAALPFEELPALQIVTVAGEACSVALATRWGRGRRFFNLYGPTEATVWATVAECDDSGRKPPIGRAILNTRVYLLDHELQPVVQGEPGELHIAGVGLARGYLNQPELSAEKFIDDPFSSEQGGRLYKTGDIGRLLADGDIEFVGRKDDQVKLRGFRIELGEVEAALHSHPAVQDAVVCLKKGAGGDQLLAAYVVPDHDGEWQRSYDGRRSSSADAAKLSTSARIARLRRHLEQQLPNYMIPGAIILMDTLPLTIQGKVDRRALPQPLADRSWLSTDYSAPLTPFQQQLTSIWERVLKVDTIGVKDNFFELGGDSLLGAVLINALQQELGVQLYIAALFDAPTIAGQELYLKKEFPQETAPHCGELQSMHTASDSSIAATCGDVRHSIADSIGEFRSSAAAWRTRGSGSRGAWKRPANRRMGFILSPPRSGSSLLRIMLAGNPGVFAPPELELLSFDSLQQRRKCLSGRLGFMREGLVRAVMEINHCGAGDAEMLIATHEAGGDSSQMFYRQLQEWIGERLLVDKSTTYALSVETLAHAEEGFEENLYIHLVRHPYATILSFEEARLDTVLNFDKERRFSVREFAELTWIISHQNILGFLSQVPAHRQLQVQFEQLVRNPRPVIESICDLLEVEFDPVMIEPYMHQEQRMTDGANPLSVGMTDNKFHQHKGIDSTAAERWRDVYSEEFLSDDAWRLAAQLGYSRQMATPLKSASAVSANIDALDRATYDSVNPPLQSYAQQRLWFVDRLAPGNPGYNTIRVIQLDGILDVDALQRSLNEIIRRHEVCRTNYGIKDGEPVQIIHPEQPLTLRQIDLGGLPPDTRQEQLDRLIAAETLGAFDLAGDHLCRGVLLRLDERRHILLFAIHHILSDAWSRGIIHQELSQLYPAFMQGRRSPLAEPAFQYADYAAWQRRLLKGALGERLRTFWLQQMHDAPTMLELPTDRPRPASQTFEGAEATFRLPDALLRKLKSLGHQQEASLFMTLLSAFNILLSRYSEQRDIITGIPVSGRNRAEFEHIIGKFLNILPLRTRVSTDDSFIDLLRQVRETSVAAYSHQEYPFDLLVSGLKLERSLDRHPLFQVMFQLHQPLLQDLDLPGLQCTALSTGPRPMPYDLTMTAVDEADGLDIIIDYNIALFDAGSIERMAAHYVRLLESITAAPHARISELSLLTQDERRRLLEEWNGTQRAYPRETCVHRLFEQQAARTPQAIAAEYADGRLSYAQLDSRANRVAHYLHSLEAGPGVLVGLSMERSTQMLVAMLGILKAGAAYVPLDPEYPLERLEFMLQDTGAPLVLTHSSVADKLPQSAAKIICIDSDWPQIESFSDAEMDGGAVADDLAYVIYTSGSTGTPKGVEVMHRSINRLVCNSDYIDIRPDDRFAQVSVVSFDAATFEIWGALLNGARVVGVPREVALNPPEFGDFLRRRSISVMFLTTALFNQMAREAAGAFQSLRYVLFGGEAVDVDPVRAVLQDGPPAHLLHVYGPTEVTTFSTWHPVRELSETATTVPIGKPIANTTAYVLDEQRMPAPVGMSGELYLGGDGVARGYLNQPELSSRQFVENPFESGPGARLYRTGDWVRYTQEGEIEFIGRRDNQVKVRGFRIELGEIETLLKRLPEVLDAVVMVREDMPGERRVVAYWRAAAGSAAERSDLRHLLKCEVPDYMLPSAFVQLQEFPLTANGKIDRAVLPVPVSSHQGEQAYQAPRSVIEKRIAAIFSEVLQLDKVGVGDNFFDLGGHSLLLVKLHGSLCEIFGDALSIVDLFQYPTVEALARRLGESTAGETAFQQVRYRVDKRRHRSSGYQPIAIVGMAGRFPGAENPEMLWRNLCAGEEFVTEFSDDDLRAAGVTEALLNHPNYVKSGVVLDGVGMFDASFFGYTPREAQLIDPQQRLFLECCWEGLENAGCDPHQYPGEIGVFAGISQNRYMKLIAEDAALSASFSDVENLISSDKDFLATRVSYKMNLKGPSLTVQTACSTSLVAVHMAAGSLQQYECDTALAGGVSIKLPQKTGYLYYPEGIASPDGHCRAFDADAQGAIRGNGAGIVILKRLEDALRDGDTIHAVIKGSAINNDGAAKVGYTAPGLEGQSEVIATAQAEAGIDPSTIGYVEAHGTGTRLGDPVEVAALTRAFRAGAFNSGYCGIGSVKTNIGHLDAAAGVTGLIKTAMALEHRELPPSLHYKKPNPEIDFANTPFYVVDRLTSWPDADFPRRAAVSSFGVGGTNAHVVLEEAPAQAPSGESRAGQLLLVSARTETALQTSLERLTSYLQEMPQAALADVAYTLQVGRQAFDWRAALVCGDAGQAIEILSAPASVRLQRNRVTTAQRPVVFMFTGQGSQYPHMGAGLYESEAIYREAVERCSSHLQQHLQMDLLAVLYPQPGDDDAAAERLRDTRFAQPALFVTEYALAQLWMSWGIEPEAMIGHSIGEYVAACLAGVLTLEDALLLVAERGRLISELESGAGAMLAATLSEAEIEPLLGESLSLAAVNAPQLCVVSGPAAAIDELEGELRGQGLEPVRLHTSHAFHSSMMEPVLDEFAGLVSQLTLNAPQRPYLSNVSGAWISAEEAVDPHYWVKHLRYGVHFSAGIEQLLEDETRIFLEVGPGQTLSGLVRQHLPVGASGERVFNSLRGPREELADETRLLETLGGMWLAGVTVDWRGFSAAEERRRTPLPTYPFERQKYWVGDQQHRRQTAAGKKNPDINSWFYTPAWRRSVLPPAPESDGMRKPCLVFVDEHGVGERLLPALAARGGDIIEVRRAGNYTQPGNGGSYTLNPAAPDDYISLITDLRAARRMPGVILHLWGVDATEQTDESGCRRNRELGFYSLLFLAQALGDSAETDINVVTHSLHDVTGGELLCPDMALILGPCKVIPDEYPSLCCRNIDLAAAELQEDATVEQLLAEIESEAGEPVVAYRGGQRWTEEFQPLPLTTPAAEPAILQQGGVYLVTGGLGGIGLALAGYLARSLQARLVLTSRSPFPPQRQWPQWLDQHADDDATTLKIQQLQEMQATGAEVLVLRADVADAAEMRTGLKRARERFGPIQGVIHSAGVGGGGVIRLKTRTDVAGVLAAKVQGTMVLQNLLEEEKPDFMVLCSSLVSILGGASRVDYCAANAYLDAFASYHRLRSGVPTIAINWDTWREVGMAVETELPAEMAARRDRILQTGIMLEEGVEIFRRILAAQPLLPQILVSTRDLESRLPGREIPVDTVATATSEMNEESGPTGTEGYERPSQVSTPYVAPTAPTQQMVADIWQEMLGIEQVGVDDNFFELGGHSLLAIRVLGRTNETFDLKLSFQNLFDVPTVAELSKKIDELRSEHQPDYEAIASLLDNVEQHSEEEIREFLNSDVRAGGGTKDILVTSPGSTGITDSTSNNRKETE